LKENRAILLDESHKLDPWPLDEGPRPKRWQIQAKSTWHHFGEKINPFKPKKKKKLKMRARDLKNQHTSYGPRQGPTQGLNLLQTSPN
jgi:hypothetical protein